MRWGILAVVGLCLVLPLRSSAEECVEPHDKLERLLAGLEPLLQERYRIHMDPVPEAKKAQARAAVERARKQLDAVPACILNSHGVVDVYIHTNDDYAGAHYAPEIDWQTLAKNINDILSQGTIGGPQPKKKLKPRPVDVKPGAIHLSLKVLAPSARASS